MNNPLKNPLTMPQSGEYSDEIIAAIIEGEYSWACALYLQSKGYDPVEYMPHRTYSRLLRKHYPQVDAS